MEARLFQAVAISLMEGLLALWVRSFFRQTFGADLDWAQEAVINVAGLGAVLGAVSAFVFGLLAAAAEGIRRYGYVRAEWEDIKHGRYR